LVSIPPSALIGEAGKEQKIASQGVALMHRAGTHLRLTAADANTQVSINIIMIMINKNNNKIIIIITLRNNDTKINK
jgi:hypothetical protein